MLIELQSDGHAVRVDGKPLDPGPSLAVFNHSPTGFSWGYGGSGPAQLALALLLAAGCDADTAVRLHQNLKWDHVCMWEKGEQTIDLDVAGWAAERRGTQFYALARGDTGAWYEVRVYTAFGSNHGSETYDAVKDAAGASDFMASVWRFKDSDESHVVHVAFAVEYPDDPAQRGQSDALVRLLHDAAMQSAAFEDTPDGERAAELIKRRNRELAEALHG